MTKWKIYNEDAVEWAKNYQKGKFHALLCDAPYHLTSIVKRFGKKNSAPAQFGTDGVFSRSSKGFMGQQWDGGDLAFRPETWEAFGQVLHPGAFGMAFSASRNWHRMAVAIEDVGFILHPTIFLWAQGQGFPKATNISKQLDYHDGNQTWEGHRYGLQALKPAVEPIIVFQKPYEGKPLENIVRTGAGALNIDAARIPLAGDGDEYVINEFEDGMKPFGNGAGHKYKSKRVEKLSGSKKGFRTGKGFGNTLGHGDVVASEEEYNPSGRWPANLILDEDAAQRLDEQSGERPVSGSAKNGRPAVGKYKGGFGGGIGKHQGPLHNDSGGASRFFYRVQEQLDENDPVYYCGKVSPKERNAGLDEMDDIDEKRFGGGKGLSGRTQLPDGTWVNTDYKNRKTVKNNHPTLKPINLAKYLATLLLPPIDYAPRRIFIPFSGVASEMIGAALAGWEHVVGVEFDKENNYVEIAEKRLEYWLKDL